MELNVYVPSRSISAKISRPLTLVSFGYGVRVGQGVAVFVGVRVGALVLVGVSVAVGVGVLVGMGVAVLVGVAVGALVGVGGTVGAGTGAGADGIDRSEESPQAARVSASIKNKADNEKSVRMKKPLCGCRYRVAIATYASMPT